MLLTTHSPALLDCFDVKNIRVVEMKEGKTVVGPVAEDQQAAVRDRLLSTGELLSIENARLEPAAQS